MRAIAETTPLSLTSMKLLFRLPAAALCLLLTGLPARAVKVAGVEVAPSATVAGQALTLNGAGLRTKLIFKVYVAGLYLGQQASTPEAVYQDTGPKRLQVFMLRDINADQLGRLFTQGMQDNASKTAFSKSIPGMLRMSQIFSDRKKLLAGDTFSVDWVPGQGTFIRVNGEPVSEPIVEPEFFRSLMSIWLGKHPAEDSLKAALLGQKSPEPQNAAPTGN